MAGSKSDRKINAKFDIFANNEGANDEVRVGYIDSKRGYISGLTVYEANRYAEKNPGTQFISANRDRVRYLNINEVNTLTNKSVLPKSRPQGLVDNTTDEFDPCNTVRGFTTDPDKASNDNAGGEPEIKPPITNGDGGFNTEDNYKKYNQKARTRIELQGGGGIGALATPIIGEDGSILHARVISGGFGYRIPPQVRIIDDNKRGSGARGFSILGNTALVEENFDEDADVEEYDFSLGEFNFDPDDSPWGSVYSMSTQTVIGDWNPANVISLTQTTGFQQELQAYLSFLKGFDPNKPWWTTRDETPVRVIGDGTKKKAKKLGGILFPVETWKWSGERTQDDLFYDVEFEIYGQGSYKNRQLYFQFEAEDGSHQFRVKGVTAEGRSGKTRTQVVSLKANTTYNVTSNVRKKIKNSEQMKAEQGLIEEAGRNPKEIGGNKAIGQRSKAIFADVVGSANDNDDIQVTANIGKFKAGERTGIKFDDSGIQNKQIRLKKAIDRIQARRLDIKKELATNNNNQKLNEEHGNLTVELAETRAKQKELRKKLREIDKNENNRYRRGTFALTYRLNRKKEITFTEKIKPSFMNKYAVAPQMVSDQPGSDRAGKPYSLEYKEYFPHDGVYTFRGAADNISEVLFDGVSIMDISNTFNQKPAKKKVEVKEGLHKIQINLTNTPQKKIIKETYSADGGDKTKYRTVKFNVVGSGSGRHRKIKCVFTNKADSSDNFTIDNDGENKEVREVKRQVTAGAKYDVKFIATAEKIDPNKEREFNIKYEYANAKSFGLRVRDNGRRIEFDDDVDNGFDKNGELRIESSSPNFDVKFSNDGKKLITKGGSGDSNDITIRYKWDDNPKTKGAVLKRIEILDETWTQRGEKGSQTKTIKLGKKIPNSKNSYLEQGCIENGTKNKETKGSSNRVFADYLGSANDNDDMQIFVKKGGVFTASNKRRMNRHGDTDKGRSTFDLEYVFDEKTGGLAQDLWQDLKDKDIVDDKTGKSLERDAIEKTTVFNTKQFIDKANRPLYRMSPGVGPFGDFFNRDGVTPFNPVELEPDIPAVPPTVPKPAPFVKPKASFIQKGGNTYLKVIGTGKAKIGFRLKTDDNFVTSGVFAREVKISADGPDVLLKRTVVQDFKSYHPDGRSRGRIGRQRSGEIKEEETIKGEGTFTAGKEYKITAIGGSKTSGFKPVDNTVVFDDNITNGLDDNGNLKIRYIRALDEPKSPKVNTPEPTGSCDDYAGTHKIVWDNIVFPASGTYTVDIQVDDNVRLEIFNNKFRAQTLDVKGFRGPGKSNGMQTFALEVKKGTYKIQAFLEQIPGKSIVDGNPMGLAINIKTAYVTVRKEIILRQSWNQNPFGAALTIHAPPPPIPQEPIEKPDGPCPPNPIWTTRHPDSSDQWHPVSHRFPSGQRSWSKFMNRYAMSPVLPIGTKGSGYSGQSWDNTWTANIPYTGFYNFKGTVDNFAEVKISQDPDNSESPAKLLEVVKKVDGFRTEKKDLTSNKIFLYKGKAKIDINVRNGEIIKYKQVTKKIFNTADWLTKPTDNSERVSVDFDVYGQGSKKNMGLKFVFKEKGGGHTFTINNVEKSNATETITKRVKRNVEYKVTAIATGTHTLKNKPAAAKERTYKIEVANRGSLGRGDKAAVKSVSDKVIRFTDSTSQMDTDAEFRIKSPSPGVTAKFRGSNDNDLELVVKGDGELSLELYWNDDPRSNGESVGNIKVAGETWKQTAFKNKKDSITKTIRVGNSSNTGSVSGASSTKNISFKFSHDDARDGNRIRIPELNINSVKPSGNKGPFDPEESTARVERGKVYEVEFVTENKAFLRLRNDGKKIECNDNSDNDHKDAIITTSDGTFFDLVNGGENGQPQNIGKAKFRYGTKSKPTPAVNEEVKLVPEQGGSRVFGRGRKGTETRKPTNIIFADIVGSANDNDDMQIRSDKGEFTSSNKRMVRGTSGQGTQKRNTWDLTFKVIEAEQTVKKSITSIGEGFGKYTVKDQELSRSVTVGPPVGRELNRAPVIVNPTLATYRRGSLGPFLSPFFPFGTNESGDRLQGRTWEMVWENVEFPIAGEYKMEIEADDTLEVFLGENLKNSFGSEGYKSIGKTRVFKGVEVFFFDIPKPGKRDIKLILQNAKIPGTTFRQNPTVAACKITCEVPVEVADTRSWLINPVGISAVLLAPPCKRLVGGGHTVTNVEIIEPGNTYPPPPTGGIPSQVILTSINIERPGIGYTPGDTVSIVGVQTNIPITVGPFGRITGIGVTPVAITRYPEIITTGPPFVPSITTEFIPDTPAADPDTVIQITDLAGLKQTGYIEGRAYYGEVFFKDGTPFAGRYETAGRLIQVYATLQESIDAQVTTRPSAIQRSGTDVNSNNPRLNIPGTPDNLA